MRRYLQYRSNLACVLNSFFALVSWAMSTSQIDFDDGLNGLSHVAVSFECFLLSLVFILALDRLSQRLAQVDCEEQWCGLVCSKNSKL